MSEKIVGFVGGIGSGKDTGAEMLQAAFSKRGEKLHVRAFADPLKNLCAMFILPLYGVPTKHVYGSQADKAEVLTKYGLDVSGRDILRYVGTEGLRSVHPDIHVRMSEAGSPGGNQVFTDVRFPNEAEWIKSKGGITVRLTRGDASGPHSSDTAMDDYWCDYQIDNRRLTLDQYRARIEDLAHLLLT